MRQVDSFLPGFGWNPASLSDRKLEEELIQAVVVVIVVVVMMMMQGQIVLKKPKPPFISSISSSLSFSNPRDEGSTHRKQEQPLLNAKCIFRFNCT
jgi:hypothetical protein